MRNIGKLALASAGLIVAATVAFGLFAPAFAVADEGTPVEGGIVIGVGEETPQSDGSVEYEVTRWIEDGVEVTPVPDVRVFAGAAE